MKKFGLWIFILLLLASGCTASFFGWRAFLGPLSEIINHRVTADAGEYRVSLCLVLSGFNHHGIHVEVIPWDKGK